MVKSACQSCSPLVSLLAAVRRGDTRNRSISKQAEVSAVIRNLLKARSNCGCLGPGSGGSRRARSYVEPWFRPLGGSRKMGQQWSDISSCWTTLSLVPVKSVTVLPQCTDDAAYDPAVHWREFTGERSKLVESDIAYARVRLDLAAVPLNPFNYLVKEALPRLWSIVADSTDIFMSVEQSESGTHYDSTSSLLLVLCGHKTVYLHKKCKEITEWVGHPMWSQDCPTAENNKLVWLRFTLTPGSILFLPKGWWHNVISQAGTVSATIDVITSGQLGIIG
jgi:hypothetical protein